MELVVAFAGMVVFLLLLQGTITAAVRKAMRDVYAERDAARSESRSTGSG